MENNVEKNVVGKKKSKKNSWFFSFKNFKNPIFFFFCRFFDFSSEPLYWKMTNVFLLTKFLVRRIAVKTWLPRWCHNCSEKNGGESEEAENMWDALRAVSSNEVLITRLTSANHNAWRKIINTHTQNFDVIIYKA